MFFQKNPDMMKYSKENRKGWESSEYHKEYCLEGIEELPRPILCRKGKGEGKRIQVKLRTTLDELSKATYLGDIKTIAQLESKKVIRDGE